MDMEIDQVLEVQLKLNDKDDSQKIVLFVK